MWLRKTIQKDNKAQIHKCREKSVNKVENLSNTENIKALEFAFWSAVT